MSEESSFSVGGARDRAAAVPFRAGVIQWIREPGQGEREELGCGFWFVTPEEVPEPVDIVLHADETIHILSGRVRIEVEGGAVHELGAGGVASMNRGSKTRWSILEPTEEFFVYS